nr:hypothetical protein [Candidatus Sigynarchaeum springense]
MLYAGQYGNLVHNSIGNVLDFRTWALGLNPAIDIDELSVDGRFDLFVQYATGICHVRPP